MKVGLPLVKNLLQPLAKSILIPLGLTAVVSAVDAGIHKKVLESKFLASWRFCNITFNIT